MELDVAPLANWLVASAKLSQHPHLNLTAPIFWIPELLVEFTQHCVAPCMMADFIDHYPKQTAPFTLFVYTSAAGTFKTLKDGFAAHLRGIASSSARKYRN